MTTAQVANTETLVLPARPSRYFAHIQNDSDTDIFIKYDNSPDNVNVTNGLRLKPGQTLFLEERMSDASRWNYNNAIYAIHGSTGNKLLRIQENY
jgi:hypothetical protein